MPEVKALLRDRDGFEREYCYTVEEEFAHCQRFMWEDGNYACDCNRSLFLYQLEFDDSFPCNSRCPTIRLISLKLDGQEIYSDLPYA